MAGGPSDGTLNAADEDVARASSQRPRYLSAKVAIPFLVDLYPTAMQYLLPAAVRAQETPLSVE